MSTIDTSCAYLKKQKKTSCLPNAVKSILFIRSSSDGGSIERKPGSETPSTLSPHLRVSPKQLLIDFDASEGSLRDEVSETVPPVLKLLLQLNIIICAGRDASVSGIRLTIYWRWGHFEELSALPRSLMKRLEVGVKQLVLCLTWRSAVFSDNRNAPDSDRRSRKAASCLTTVG